MVNRQEIFLHIAGILGKQQVKKTGEELSIRGYAWMKWKDDKVETVYNAFDPTMYNASMN